MCSCSQLCFMHTWGDGERQTNPISTNKFAETPNPKSKNDQMLKPPKLKPVQLRHVHEVPLNELANALARLRRLPQSVVPQLGYNTEVLIQCCFSWNPLWLRSDLLNLAHAFYNENSWGQMRVLMRWTDKQRWRQILPWPFKRPSCKILCLARLHLSLHRNKVTAESSFLTQRHDLMNWSVGFYLMQHESLLCPRYTRMHKVGENASLSISCCFRMKLSAPFMITARSKWWQGQLLG